MRILSAFLLAFGLGCSAQTASNDGPRTRIVIDASVPEHTVPAWLAYAGMRSRWMEARDYQYTFAEEVAARYACARVWIELREFEKRKPDVHLDQLIEVFKAAYIPEYTWAYFRDTRWVQPDGLRLTEFESWRRINLSNHAPETRATAEFEAK